MPLVYVYLVLSLYLISLYDCRYLAPFVRSPVPTLLVGACWLALCVPWEKSLDLSLCVLESWDQRENFNKIQPSNGSKILYSNPSKRCKACGTLRLGLVALWNLRVKVRKATNLDWVLCSGPIRSWESGKNARKQNCSKALKTWIAWRILQTWFGILDVAAFASHLAARLCRRTQGPKECAVGVRKSSVTCRAVLRCTWISLHNCSNQTESRTTCLILIISVLTTVDNNLLVISQWWWQRARNRMTMTQRLGTGWWPKKLQHARAGLGQRE